MKKLLLKSGVVLAGLVGLFAVAGRNVRELDAYFRASADKTIDHLVAKLPDEVLDRKLVHDLKHSRQELTDRLVQLNLSRNQIGELRTDVKKLDESVSRRQRLLSEAYPILKEAIDGGKDIGQVRQCRVQVARLPA